MAKTKIRYRNRARKTYRRARGGGGKYKGVIDGVLAGAAASMIKKYVNFPFIDDLTLMGVGIFRKNQTLVTLGAVGLGSDLLGIAPGGQKNGGYIA